VEARKMVNNILRKGLVFSIICSFCVISAIPTTSGEDRIYYHAINDIEVINGQIIYSFENTFYDDNAYQGLKEKLIGGHKNGKTILEHLWVFNITGGDYSFELYLNASAFFEDFVFAYSTDNVSFTDLLTVNQGLGAYLQTASIEDNLDGLVYIRVQDLIRTKGETKVSDVYVDYLNIEATPGQDYPIISNVQAIDNDINWKNMNPTVVDGSLIGRERHAMAYDSISNIAIVYSGGQKSGPDLNDTWVYNSNENTWYNMSPIVINGALRRTHDHAMAYDSNADRTIMFGGESYDNGTWYYSGETWVYNYHENTWYNMSPNVIGGKLYGRSSHRMVYDSAADKTIMYGGAGYHFGKFYFFDETWVYDYNENTWYNMSPDVVGGILKHTGLQLMVYDSSSDKTIMFGGSNPSTQTNETWAYDYSDNTWYNLRPTIIGGTLEERTFLAGAYDSTADRIVMLGGQEQYQMKDTWIYDYTKNIWEKLKPIEIGGTLLQREAHTMVYDSAADQTILFGGFRGDGSFFDDTWTFSFDETTANITWQTDEPSDSEVYYGTSLPLTYSVGDSSMVLGHSIILEALQPDTTYYYEVQSRDNDGNIAVDNNSGAFYTFTTNQSPIITNVTTTEVTHSTAVINWVTDEPSDGIIRYGNTTALGKALSDSKLILSHSFQLTHLKPDTKYYYEVQSTDFSGKTTIDDNGGNFYTFTTAAAPSNSMHVQSIDMWFHQQGKRYKVYAKVRIVDENDNPVENAMVYVTLRRSDYNDPTNSTGFVTFLQITKIKGEYVTTVTNVTKEGWTYHPEDNVETSDSIYVS